MDRVGWWSSAVTRAGEELARLIQYPLDSGQRVYLLYLFAALVMAFVVLLWRHYQHRGKWQPWAVLTKLFARRIWWHPSARLDYQLFVLNPLIRGVLLAGGLSMVPVALAVSNGLDYLDPEFSPALSGVSLIALFTLCLFVADDFTRYWLHRALHRVPMFWALHRLHHSAEVMTPLTVYRMHPLEGVLYSLRMVLTQGVVVGVFFFFFGMGLTAWQVAGANLFTYLFNMAGANLRHSHVWLSWGRLEYLFISPAQHQIHHSRDRYHFDRNFGSFLAIWDGLFGTWMSARRQQVKAFGLADGNPHTGLAQAWLEPLGFVIRRGRQRPKAERNIKYK